MGTKESNLLIIARAIEFFCIYFNIFEFNFIDALNGTIRTAVSDYHKTTKGVEFDIETMPLDADAMGAAFDKVMEIAALAEVAAMAAIRPEDIS